MQRKRMIPRSLSPKQLCGIQGGYELTTITLTTPLLVPTTDLIGLQPGIPTQTG